MTSRDRGVSPSDARHLIDAYLDSGGNHLDVANVYAGDRAEEIVGAAVRDRRDRVVIATKVRWPVGSGPNDAGLSRYHICNAVEGSLRRLSTDVIDVLYLHDWDPWTPLTETLSAISALVDAGKVRYVGVSNFKAWQLMKALCLCEGNGWPRFVAAQYQYSLVVRDIEPEIADLCRAEGVSLVPSGPLGGGFLSGKHRRDRQPKDASDGRLASAPDAWEESWAQRATERNWNTLDTVQGIASEHERTASQVALAWLLTQPAIASVVVGARTVEQLVDNVSTCGLHLTTEELRALGLASEIPTAYPYRVVNAETH